MPSPATRVDHKNPTRLRRLVRSNFHLLRRWPRRTALSPQRERHGQRLDTGPGPPCGLVTVSVDLAVMEATNRHAELVAHLAPKGTRLGKAQVMRVGRCAAADEARMGCDEPAVLLVTQADGLCGNAATARTGGVGGTLDSPIGLRLARRYSVPRLGRTRDSRT